MYQILSEILTNGFNYNMMYIISFASILCGIFVITSKNPIISVLFLIGLFVSIAMYLFMLGTNFIGLSYLLVYVGAVSILFLFILMLINVRISELSSDNYNSIPLGVFVGVLSSTAVYELLPSNLSGIDIIQRSATTENMLIDFLHILFYSGTWQVTSQNWDGNLAQSSHITSIGSIIYTIYPILLILTSLILLLAMVGVIVITINPSSSRSDDFVNSWVDNNVSMAIATPGVARSLLMVDLILVVFCVTLATSYLLRNIILHGLRQRLSRKAFWVLNML